MDDESIYICEDDALEVDATNIVPMRCPPDTDPDVSTTESWYIASAAPNVECEFVELRFPYFWAPVITDLERPAVAGEVICLRFYLVTQTEFLTHREAVTIAIATELKTWHRYKCFSRRAKQGARNVIGCRWVIP